jgi:1,4-dihydroxy-2-naphthoyl-CoA hydrolase
MRRFRSQNADEALAPPQPSCDVSAMNEPVVDVAAEMNARSRDGWAAAMGITFVRATADEVVAEWTVGPQHLQPYGIVHGGVYSGVIETLASVGAALAALRNGSGVVGLENHTTFLRAVRSGRLEATATPLTRGRRTQVWEVAVRDDQARVVATGRVRLLCLESDGQLAGEAIKVMPT